MARRIRQDLMVNGTGTGNSFDYPGGDGMLMASATWGGGNLALQMLGPDGATWIPLQYAATTTPISITANGVAVFRAPAGPIRVVATTATAVYASVIGIPGNMAG